MKSKSDIEIKAGGGCSSHDLLAFAKVAGDPTAFYRRGQVFRGFYILGGESGIHYLTKSGEWTNGCTAPDGGNWWDTKVDAERALEKFRLANYGVEAS